MGGTKQNKQQAAKRSAKPQAKRQIKRKMAFEHRPNGVPEAKWSRWPFEPGKMSNREAEAIEDVTDWTFVTWQQMFFNGSMRAIHALLWTYLRRDPELADLDYDAVEFTDEETWFGFVGPDGKPLTEEQLIEDVAGELADDVEAALAEAAKDSGNDPGPATETPSP